MKPDVFISHAVTDKDIAEEFTRLLASGLNITGGSVFCSSLPGRTIPGGFNFVEHIKDALHSSKVVLLLLTENYLASQFCLAEIGACWVSKENVIPILVPPVEYERLKATLSITQAWKINDDDGLNSIADDIRKPLKLDADHAQWGVEKKAFIKKIDSLINDQIPPVFISPDEYEKCKKQLEYCAVKIEELGGELQKKQVLIENLKKLKDKDEVNELEIAHMDELKQFEALCQNARLAVATLPYVVGEALYHENAGRNLPKPRAIEKEAWADISNAIDLKMLELPDDDEPIEVNYEHPKVNNAYDAISDLQTFMREHEDNMHKSIEDKYGVTFDLTDLGFWRQFIG